MSQDSVRANTSYCKSEKLTNGIPKSLTILVISICWFALLTDGYDLGIYGAVLPDLLEYKEWGLSPVKAGAIGSYAFLGMLIGAVFVGTITDLIGRKWTLIWCLVLFSVMMGLSALASSPDIFGLFRFIGGIGLGGVIPTASALTVEYSPSRRRSLNYAIMFSGYSLGVVLGAILSILLLEKFGWRLMFWIGATPLFLVPFIIRYMPESISFLVTRKRLTEAEKICEQYQLSLSSIISRNKNVRQPVTNRKFHGLSTLLTKRFAQATIFFWITYVMGFYLVYGLNTWLPQMMRLAGYPLGSSLSFLLTLNLTAAVGAIFAGALADRWGSKRVISVSYLLAALCIGWLTIESSAFVVYLLVGVAGFGSVGNTQILNAYVTKYFPSDSRATALGWGLGFGRLGALSGPLAIGWLMTMQYEQIWSFFTFVVAGVIASIAVLLIPRNRNEII